eukprot:scaffold269432_cov36-Tisochrysis_lutea.AAC.1
MPSPPSSDQESMDGAGLDADEVSDHEVPLERPTVGRRPGRPKKGSADGGALQSGRRSRGRPAGSPDGTT